MAFRNFLFELWEFVVKKKWRIPNPNNGDLARILKAEGPVGKIRYCKGMVCVHLNKRKPMGFLLRYHAREIRV